MRMVSVIMGKTTQEETTKDRKLFDVVHTIRDRKMHLVTRTDLDPSCFCYEQFVTPMETTYGNET